MDPESAKRHTSLMTRRHFLKASALLCAGCSLRAFPLDTDRRAIAAQVRFRIVTDVHYADTEPRGVRHYRQSLSKMRECVRRMNQERVDFLIELGDFIDQDPLAKQERILDDLKTIEGVYGGFQGPRYHVLGNHDLDGLSKSDFLAVVENTHVATHRTYDSFDLKGLHFVVLDANYRSDGLDYAAGNYTWNDANLPDAELRWLSRNLRETLDPCIIFVHQPLDGEETYSVRNAAAARRILEKHGNVLAVFQGHFHPGRYREIGGIHFYTLKAMVDGFGAENNSYAIVEVHTDYSITVTGCRRAANGRLPRVHPPYRWRNKTGAAT